MINGLKKGRDVIGWSSLRAAEQDTAVTARKKKKVLPPLYLGALNNCTSLDAMHQFFHEKKKKKKKSSRVITCTILLPIVRKLYCII